MASSAVQKVFGTTELLEMILLHLPTALPAVQGDSRRASLASSAYPILAVTRVSRSFKETIHGSTSIQRCLLRPMCLPWEWYSQDVTHLDIAMGHGSQLFFQWQSAIKEGMIYGSWKDVVFLGDAECAVCVRFGKLWIDVKPGETFAQVLEDWKAAVARRRLEAGPIKGGRVKDGHFRRFWSRLQKLVRGKR